MAGNKPIDLKLNYYIPKYLISGEKISNLFSIKNFGKKYSGLYYTFLSLKISSLDYGNKEYDFWFYRSAKNLGALARLSEKQVQRYVQVLIRLKLIIAIKNPKGKDLNANPGLKKLLEENFKQLPNKPIYFFRIVNLSIESIDKAMLIAKDVNKWFDDKYHLKIRAAKTRALKKFEISFGKTRE